MIDRRPPRLLVKTLTVAFLTVALLLGVVFVVVTVTVRNQVRQAVASNLESTQRLFAAVETRRQRELRAQAETLADNATLKAALDTYLSETRGTGGTGRSDGEVRADLLETIDLVLERVAARSTRTRSCWSTTTGSRSAPPAGWRIAGRASRPVSLGSNQGRQTASTASRDWATDVFRVVTVPLLLDDATIGMLYVATSLDQQYARGAGSAGGHPDRDRQRRTRAGDDAVDRSAAHQFESAVAVVTAGRRHAHARRRILRVPAARRGRRHGVLRARID